MKAVAPLAVLFELLHPYGFNAVQLKNIYRSLGTESGKLFYSENYVLLRDRDYLFLKRREESKEDQSYTLHQEICQIEDGFEVSRNPELACLDADTVKEPLVLRRWQSGDKFGKYSLFEKENQYVVCSGENIVWLVNERTDNRFRVTEKTQRVLKLWID